jgi:hypothetical protein
MRSLRSSEIGTPRSELGGGTSNNRDKVIEADSSVALVCLLEGSLQLRVLILCQNAPLLIQEFVKICTAFPSHRVIFLYV